MKILFYLVIVVILFNNYIFAQEEKSENVFEVNDSKELIKMYKNFTDVKFLFSPIYLQLEQDSTISGLFLGLINREIHILQDQKIVYLNIENAKKIRIQYKDLCHSDFFNAFFMGAYAMLLFYQIDNYGSTYNWTFLKEKREESFLIDPRFLSSFASASVCGILSYVATKSNRVLDFEMKEELFSDEDINYEFSKFLKGETNQKKLHFKFQFGWINPSIKNLSTNNTIPQNNTYFSENIATNFKIFRNLNLSYSLLNDLDLGISYYNLSENDNRFSTDSFFVYLRYENSAYMLNAYYYPFRKWLPSIIDFNVGAGMGIANIQFSYPEIYHIISQPNNNKIIHKTNSYNKFCLLANIDLGINITNNFTLGLSTDYFIIPGDFKFPEANNRQIFPDNINLSNLFIGFYLKYNLIDYF